MVYQFKIKLKDISKPPVWRRVEVPSHFSFFDFNKVIQFAFGWQIAHLWNLTDRKGMFGRETIRIAEPSEYDGEYYARKKMRLGIQMISTQKTSATLTPLS